MKANRFFPIYFLCRVMDLTRLRYRWLPLLLMIPPALLLSKPAQGSFVPQQFVAEYSLSIGAIQFGQTTQRLERRAENDFVFESVTKPVGIFTWILDTRIRERSRWNYENGLIQSVQYEFRQSGRKDRTVNLEFDWQQKLVTGRKDADRISLDVEAGVKDRLNYQLAIMQDLRSGEREFDYKIVDDDELKTYHIVAQGEEELKTHLGRLRTIKISHTSENKRTVMWCAPELDFLPVRIEHARKDESPYTAKILRVDGIKREQ